MLVQYIIIGSILVFIIILILIFAFTGHLRDNPHGILIILLIGVLLFSGYMILAYYKQWWPYSTSPNNYNNIILYFTLGIMVITALILAYVIYLAFKHHKQKQMYVIHKTKSESDLNKQENITQYETKQSMDNEGLEREAIERLALEHQLQEEGSNLEKGSNIKIATREKILAEELENKNISQDVAEEGIEMAALKELEATRALRSELPSVQMFGEEGTEDLINGVRTIPSELKPEIKRELAKERIENRRRVRESNNKTRSERFEEPESENIERDEEPENQRSSERFEEPESENVERDEEPKNYKEPKERFEKPKSEKYDDEKINGFESEGENIQTSEGEGLLSEIESKAESAGSEIESKAEKITPELEEVGEEAGEVAE